MTYGLCPHFIDAGVVELVDAPDSKSGSQKECRFDSDHPHHSNLTFLSILVASFVVLLPVALAGELFLFGRPIATTELFCLPFFHKVTPEGKCA